MAAYTRLSSETEAARWQSGLGRCAAVHSVRETPARSAPTSAAFRKQEVRLNQHLIGSVLMMVAIGLAATGNAAGPKESKEIVRNFLKSFETGTTAPLSLVDGSKLIQHNSHVEDGAEGL